MAILTSTQIILLIAILIIIIIFIIILIRKLHYVKNKVRKMIHEGKDIAEILEYGRYKKWNSREVELYFLTFVTQEYLERGYRLDKIGKTAINNGWPREMINTVFSKLR